MNTIDDGGPAFPCDSRDSREFAGMSLRDWFAGQALPAIIADESRSSNFETTENSGTNGAQENQYATIANDAYAIAEALLTARKGLAVAGIAPGEKVESMDLSVRTINALDRAEVVYVSELVKKTELDLLSMRNFGRTSLREIKRKLGERGLALRGSKVWSTTI